MTIHKNNLGFTFDTNFVNVFYDGHLVLANVSVHFDDGPLAGLQLGGLKILDRPELGSIQFVPGTSGLGVANGGSIEPFCEEALNAYEEFRSLSAADPSIDGYASNQTGSSL